MEKSNSSRNHIGHFIRVIRPLIWWLILVLVLYGIRTHERLLEKTRLEFGVSLQGQPIDAVAKLDGMPALTGQKISLGRHTFSVTYSKAEPFSTNLFIWYGPHDMENIKLKRSMGTLRVAATPSASSITITGSEFSTNLYDSSGITLNVPTDQYTVRAEYPHWSQTQNPTVVANQTLPCMFAPQFGALYLTCNKDGARYQVESNGQSVDSGNVPATVNGLPIGNFNVTILYHNRQMQSPVSVEAGVTNELPVQFVLGAARLETVPPNAQVFTANGHYLGQTPLLFPDITPQKAQFNLSLAGYEPVSVALKIAADQTNSFSTNLISVNYVSSMQAAKGYLAESNYEAAVQAAGAALNAQPNDADALALQGTVQSGLDAQKERLDMLTRPQRVFGNLCANYWDAGLFTPHEFKTIKPAKAVAQAIVSALTNAPGAFQIIKDDSTEPEIYQVVGQQTFSLGILGGTERDCLIVIGQSKDDETQIWFKVLEYQVQHSISATGFNIRDSRHLIAMSPSRLQMNGLLEDQISRGLRSVAERIQEGVDEASSVIQ